MEPFKKGSTVFYKTAGGTFRARVERLHRDGTVSVTAMFPVGPDGADLLGYLGFKHRTSADRLFGTASQAAASFAA